jgi:hypothetical protein
MTSKGKAIPTDVYDEEGNLLRIDFHDGLGDFILQFLWDETDEQTSPNREAFRKWAYRWMKQNDWSIHV